MITLPEAVVLGWGLLALLVGLLVVAVGSGDRD